MENPPENQSVINRLIEKGTLKKEIYSNTFNVFEILKHVAKELSEEIKNEFRQQNVDLRIDFKEREFSCELVFAGDMIFSVMHTNIFQFPRDHEVMSTSYIKEDISRSYCGVIKLYNFLADSFIYNRLEDIGYLIARIYVNKEMHYFVEGKRQVGLLYNNFDSSVIDKQAIKKILETAILYSVQFDLLTPPFETIKEMTVEQMKLISESMQLKTGKRLGFRFNADHEDELKKIKENHFKGKTN